MTARFTLGALALLLSSTAALAQASAPDAIYFGGDIVTMDDAALFAEAVAVEDGRITHVGRLREIQTLADAHTRMVDLQGHTMVPGFIDPHGHFLPTGMNLATVDLTPPPMGTITTMDELVAALWEWAETHPDAPVIVGSSYDDTLLAERRHPNRRDLDRVSTDRPVVIVHISGHVNAGNSRALELAGIDADTPNPDGGRIVRDAETGEANGVMEGNARALLAAIIPPTSRADQLQAVRLASAMWASAGFTTATDNIFDPGVIDLYREALDTGDLPVRLTYWPRSMTLEGARGFPAIGPGYDASDGRQMISQGPIKLSIDGSPQGYTAHFSQPYMTQRPQDDGNYRGFPYWDDRDAFMDFVAALHAEGWQITVHGNGDQGIQDVLEAYANAQRLSPRADARHTIQHAQFTRPDQLDQMAALDVHPSFFIGHTFYWGDRHQDVFFGEHRAAHMSPLRGAYDHGLTPTTHTDSGVTPIDGIQMIWSSVNRMSTGGQVIGTDQRVTPLEALRAITINAAWQYFQEDRLGSIEPGKLADFVILSDNPLTLGHLDPMRIMEIRVLETIVGGETVFSGETESIVARHFRRVGLPQPHP